MDDVEFLPPVEKPDKIICVGINFPDHATEADAGEIPPYPSLFARFASSQVGHGLPLRAPHNSEKFDYEGELAVVIGQPGRDVKERDAGRLVGGYTCFAENSVRDFQAHSRQVTPGKNFQSSGAIGPWVTTPDEIEDPAAMEVITRLNGEEMQRAPVSTMIYSVPRVLSYISSFTTLLPGDIIAMGTPAGVGMKRTPPVWLKPGDVLEVEVTGVGVLRNPVVASSGGRGA
jgi:2-keto-4-pentenoate hydratase/2-oxohepta-3-ene-1,7-dioic acid hydratase in catechol pathway